MANSRQGIALAVDRLNENPLFHMSLGSRELFHSNLLAYLFKTYPQEALILLNGSLREGPAKELEIQREENHIDLRVTFPGFKPIVIENKVKSLPDLDQLDDYAWAFAKEDVEFLLLSLAPKPWPGEKHGNWKYLGYAELRDRLILMAEQIKLNRGPCFDVGVIQHYASMIAGLIEVAEQAKPTLEDLFFRQDLRPLLHKGRVDSLYYKLRAGYLKNSIRVAIEQLIRRKHLDPEKYFYRDDSLRANKVPLKLVQSDLPQFKVGSGFTNGTALVDVFCKLPDKEDVLGIQLQYPQFRLFIQTPDGLTRTPREKRAQDILQSSWNWFNFDPLRRVLGTDVKLRPEDDSKWGGFEKDFVHRFAIMVKGGGKSSQDDRLPEDLPMGKLVEAFLAYVEEIFTFFECHA